MKTWKTKRTVCRRSSNGRFTKKGNCKRFKRTKVKVGFFGGLFGLLLICLSCQAMPPAHKVFSLACDLPTAGGPVTGANLYGASVTDTNWQLLASISGTNGQTVRFASPPRFDLYTADSTNAVDGSASDYSNIFTNSPPLPPSRPK